MGELTNLLEKLRREAPPAFDNADYQVRLSHTVETDMRIMSFVDVLWDFEVTGGIDQFEPLTIISVCMRKDPRRNLRKDGKAIEAGMRVNDIILQINDTPADNLTLMEACEMIRQSGKHVRIYVKGSGYADPDLAQYNVTLWYKIPAKSDGGHKWEGSFPWNDKGTKILRNYRESNCFLVPSKLKSKFASKFEKPATDRFFPKVTVDSIWNRKWHLKDTDYIEESFETHTLPMPKKRTAA